MFPSKPRTHTKNPLIFCDSPFKKITLDVCDPTKSTALKRGKFSKRKNREGERAAGLCPRELARTATRGRRCQGKEVKSLRNRGTKFFFFYRHFLLSHPLLPVITVAHLYLHRIPTVFLLSLSSIFSPDSAVLYSLWPSLICLSSALFSSGIIASDPIPGITFQEHG